MEKRIKLLQKLPNNKEDLLRVIKSNLQTTQILRNMLCNNNWLTDELNEAFEDIFKNIYWIEDEVSAKSEEEIYEFVKSA